MASRAADLDAARQILKELIMAMDKFVPNKTQFIRIVIGVAILFMILKFLPVPMQVKNIFVPDIVV